MHVLHLLYSHNFILNNFLYGSRNNTCIVFIRYILSYCRHEIHFVSLLLIIGYLGFQKLIFSYCISHCNNQLKCLLNYFLIGKFDQKTNKYWQIYRCGFTRPRLSYLSFFYFALLFFKISLLFSYSFCLSPHNMPPPQPSPPPSPDSASPLGFAHVSFIVVPENPSFFSLNYPLPSPVWLLSVCS